VPSALKMPQEPALWIIGALLLLALLGVGGWWLKLRSDLNRVNTQIAAAQKEIEELKPILAEVEEYKSKKAQLEHKIQVINELKVNQRGPVQIMDYVSRAVPELLWISRLELRGNSISVRGSAFNTNAVAAFIENLNKVPEFGEPVLRDTSRRGQVFTYDIVFSFSFAKPQVEASGEATAAGASPAGPTPAAKS
jgi:type IV pilus assembly protein PilN